MSSPSDTIVACASGSAPAARALVRVSGEGVGALCERLLQGPMPGACGPARLALTDRLSLPCLAARGVAPATYTGEETLELLIPGSPHVVRRVIDQLLTLPGVRQAEPGEFSARAYLHGKLTLEQAEGVAAVIAAQNDAQLAAAGAVLRGQTGGRYREWAEELAGLLALVEAGIDFTDQEDVVPIVPADLRSRLDSLAEALAAHLGGRRGRMEPAHRPLVVLAGEPNAGKSTLFNALLGRRRAITSPAAGTTRDALTETLTIESPGRETVEVTLADIAGLDGEAVGGSAGGAQSLARETLTGADLVLHCDPLGRFASLGLPAGTHVMRVRTKADRPAPSQAADAIAVCALTAHNLGALREAMHEALWSAGPRAGEAAVVPRHARALGAALMAMQDGAASINSAAHALATPEVTASHLRSALDALGEITGRIEPDRVIGRIFATFCIGK